MASVSPYDIGRAFSYWYYAYVNERRDDCFRFYRPQSTIIVGELSAEPAIVVQGCDQSEVCNARDYRFPSSCAAVLMTIDAYSNAPDNSIVTLMITGHYTVPADEVAPPIPFSEFFVLHNDGQVYWIKHHVRRLMVHPIAPPASQPVAEPAEVKEPVTAAEAVKAEPKAERKEQKREPKREKKEDTPKPTERKPERKVAGVRGKPRSVFRGAIDDETFARQVFVRLAGPGEVVDLETEFKKINNTHEAFELTKVNGNTAFASFATVEEAHHMCGEHRIEGTKKVVIVEPRQRETRRR
ncbi:Nuclear transport factor 2 domain [Carpediemonas membranifera]|uniref:Nuclear transport factor 2 domain n=1 Tax=Carpediemonas membranifera TaxID=201153 RepID=A0A8J6AZ78_9EUKA|nr:Nuclear transport factor 2 domain [Carpediemonas membranifera]|eukprot:KAG9390859.1 Nuclear transport factor 2 domain [Carpediemonas membranifera]